MISVRPPIRRDLHTRRLLHLAAVSSLIVLVALLTTIDANAQSSGTFIPAGSMPSARRSAASALLPNNIVLAMGGLDIGGTLSSMVAYNSSSNTFTSVGNADAPYDTLVLLNSGKVLLVGRGNSITVSSDSSVRTSAEIFDPVSGTFTSTGPLLEGISSAAAVRLSDGRVLIVGGRIYNQSAEPTATAELYNPASGTFAFTGSMTTPRFNHTATLLRNGEVLVAGGTASSISMAPVASAELYDPIAGTFAPLAAMTTAHANHTATLLADGRVLIAGGAVLPRNSKNSVTAVAEIYDPSTQMFSVTGPMLTPREFHSATRLDNDEVLIAGGDNAFNVLASTELYDPTVGTFSTAATMVSPREQFIAALLGDGDVLVAGGLTRFAEGANTATAELFIP
jgi:galactose oxidase-like protein